MLNSSSRNPFPTTACSLSLQFLTVMSLATVALYYMKRSKFSIIKSRKLAYAPKNYSETQKFRLEN